MLTTIWKYPDTTRCYPRILAKCHSIDFRELPTPTLRNVAIDMHQFFTDFVVLPTNEMGNRANEPKTRKCESTYVDNNCKAVAFVDMTVSVFIFQGTKLLHPSAFPTSLRPYRLAPYVVWCCALDDLSILQNH